MASTLQTLDDGEFWLPPQFLDDDVFVEKKNGATLNNNTKCLFSPFEAFAFNGSDLSSPGSTDSIESDEEDFLAELTRKMAHSTLQDDKTSSKGWGISTSPQSTLSGSGCGCRRGSSPNGPSPAATWDLLYAAAGEVARMRANQELYGCLNNSNNRNGPNGFFAPPRKHSPISSTLNHSHLPDLALYQKLQASQFHHLRQQQVMKRQQQQQYRCHVQGRPARTNNTVGNDNTRLLGLSQNAWPPLNQIQQSQNGSGMRAVFLGNPGTKRECAGTGVFLPRRVGTPTEPRKKPACSPVLLPAKVVQALNLNMEDVGPTLVPQVHHQRFNNGFSAEKRNIKPQVINLPSEWTY